MLWQVSDSGKSCGFMYALDALDRVDVATSVANDLAFPATEAAGAAERGGGHNATMLQSGQLRVLTIGCVAIHS
jgi:hypothetical protein